MSKGQILRVGHLDGTSPGITASLHFIIRRTELFSCQKNPVTTQMTKTGQAECLSQRDPNRPAPPAANQEAAKPGRMQVLFARKLVGLEPLSRCSGSPKKDRRKGVKDHFRSDSNPRITMAGGTLPTPLMNGVNRRARKGLQLSFTNSSSCQIKESSRQDCKGRTGSLRAPFVLRHNCSPASQLEPYVPKPWCSLAGHPWESLSPLPLPGNSGGSRRT